jgi:hypothetical protein
MIVRLLIFCHAILWGCTAWADEIYANDFHDPAGTSYTEWTSSPITYASKPHPDNKGALPAPKVSVVDVLGHGKCLGEFGGPMIGKPGDPDFNQMRVDQTVTLSLKNLPRHEVLKVSFDLLILKSWDGNSPIYGPDRWELWADDKPPIISTTFSNNPKVQQEGSDQDYPKPHSAPRTGARPLSPGTPRAFFQDSVYHLEFRFPHQAKDLALHFHSSLFEGKGTTDESWALARVKIESVSPK